MKNVLVVLNCNAGRKCAIKYRKRLHKFLFEHAKTFKFISIEELDTIDIAPFDTIIAMGGDGTISKIVPYVIKNNLTLGIIPCGTANLLAEKLGIPQNFNKALKILQKGATQSIDVMTVNGRYSPLRLGLGYDSDIICKTPQSLKNNFGYFAYFIAGIIFALRLKKRFYELETPSGTKGMLASCIIVANAANMYRNLISVGKNSSLTDGLLDVFILKTTNPILFFFELIKLFLNNFSSSKYSEWFQTDKISIKTKWLAAHIDGEKNNFQNKIEICVKPEILKIYTNIKNCKKTYKNY